MNTDQDQLVVSSSVSIGAPSVAHAVVPISRCPLSFRLATLADIPALDALQKRYNKALGYFKTEWFEGYIKTGGVLVAEEVTGHSSLVTGQGGNPPPSLTSDKGQVTNDRILGYCISRDQYLKRDELGIIYQLCVAPGEQRKLVGAALLREVFARSAYGCKLYCLWCAQDLDANYFWESMGFLPIAFRTGSKSKGPKGSARVHIFWERRIREGDTTTPIWFPAKTSGGTMGEERLVLPIPPGETLAG
jgi:ribosomal protein S18 acetylase RimI-like enzyme